MTEIEPGHIVRHDGEEKVVIDVATVDAVTEEEQDHADEEGHCQLAMLRDQDDDSDNGPETITAAYCYQLEIVGHI